ncbi:PLP-dependent aminotransferase family protein [Hymenobacter sp. B81]|uniref:PLP-dependent aminotransferase family protein n=1 Tax=Hymenobacter sp. B81 TaxID=3344878 RepID=UPI0037DCEF60
MLPYQTLLVLNRHAPATLTQQLSTGLIHLMQQGLLPGGSRLPGARTLATLLGVHRQTVAVAFEELAVQGWVELRPARAPRVSPHLPDLGPQPLSLAPGQLAPRAGFSFPPSSIAGEWWPTPHTQWLDDGSPDSRLAPLPALARNYRRASKRLVHPTYLGYTDPNGSLHLRRQLSQYLRATRGVPADPEHIFTTRGSIMGIYLLAQLLLAPGDTVVVAEVGYRSAEDIFEQWGARLQRVRLDGDGLCVEDVAALCQRQRVRLLYLTPHHHYPTTVTLSATRRMQLLHLAAAHDFIILEDDYDFDYHYEGSPVLPLASADRQGRVVYVGSLSKALSPAVRLGYVVASPDVVTALSAQRRLVDRQGDALVEEAVAELLAEGELTRHLKRARQHYRHRRDACVQALQAALDGWLTVTVPAGGLALWACWRPDIDLLRVVAHGQQLGLSYTGERHQLATGQWGFRLGFASLTPIEMTHRLDLLRQTVQTCYDR